MASFFRDRKAKLRPARGEGPAGLVFHPAESSLDVGHVLISPLDEDLGGLLGAHPHLTAHHQPGVLREVGLDHLEEIGVLDHAPSLAVEMQDGDVHRPLGVSLGELRDRPDVDVALLLLAVHPAVCVFGCDLRNVHGESPR